MFITSGMFPLRQFLYTQDDPSELQILEIMDGREDAFIKSKVG